MPDDDKHSDTSKQPADNAPSKATTPGRNLFALPAPLKRIFDQFPLVTYDANELPERAPKARDEHVLHIFTTQEDAVRGRPSFNPGCLKWQVRQAHQNAVYASPRADTDRACRRTSDSSMSHFEPCHLPTMPRPAGCFPSSSRPSLLLNQTTLSIRFQVTS